jgi:hypothetical protein
MSEVLERLLPFDGVAVVVAMLRAADQTQRPVRRYGTLRLCVPRDILVGRVRARSDAPIVRIVDAAGLPIATLHGRDELALALEGEALRWRLRPTFRIDVLERGGAEVGPPEIPLDYDAATREMATEMEAGYRAALRMRPDPTPEAGVRALHGVPPVEPGPLPDGSVRFAVGHTSATIRPDGTNALRCTCIETTIVRNRQYAVAFEPPRGPRYALGTSDVARLAADVRAFFSHRRDGFNALTRGPDA